MPPPPLPALLFLILTLAASLHFATLYILPLALLPTLKLIEYILIPTNATHTHKHNITDPAAVAHTKQKQVTKPTTKHTTSPQKTQKQITTTSQQQQKQQQRVQSTQPKFTPQRPQTQEIPATPSLFTPQYISTPAHNQRNGTQPGNRTTTPARQTSTTPFSPSAQIIPSTPWQGTPVRASNVFSPLQATPSTPWQASPAQPAQWNAFATPATNQWNGIGIQANVPNSWNVLATPAATQNTWSPLSPSIVQMKNNAAVVPATQSESSSFFKTNSDTSTYYNPFSPFKMDTSTPIIQETLKFQPTTSMTLPSTFNMAGVEKIAKREWTLPAEGEVEIWVEKLRKWISARILHTLQGEINIADSDFKTKNMDHLNVSNAVWPLDSSKTLPILPGLQYTAATTQPSMGAGMFGGFSNFGSNNNTFGAGASGFGQNTMQTSTPQTLPDLLPKQQETSIRARLRSERSLFRKEWYLPAPPLSVRKHLLNRVTALVSGSFLAEYVESDTEIVMHMFGCFMDERVAGENGFSSEVICWRNKRPDFQKNETQFWYYADRWLLVIEGEVWDVPAGRNNLFYALTLWAWYYKEKRHSVYEMCDLAGKGFGIMEIFT